MAENQYQNLNDGQELQQSDINQVAKEAALADDRVLAELIRLVPYNGAVVKAIVPYGIEGAGTQSQAAPVQPNGSSGSVLVMPFKAIVGSRTAISGMSAGTTDDSARANWRDVRSVSYAPSDDGVNLGHAVAVGANSSGSPRVDLLYALVQTNANTAQVQRFVKAPGSPATQAAVATNVVVNLTEIVSIAIVAGTPGAMPSPPATPSDTLGDVGSYYIPLAYLYIPNGFSGISVVSSGMIQIIAPIAFLSSVHGSLRYGPPNRLSSQLPTAIATAWGVTGTRPQEAIPTAWISKREMAFGLNATGASPSIADAGIIDDSANWRKRKFTVKCVSKVGATQFAYQYLAVSGAIPSVGCVSVTQEGQSFVDDSAAVLGITSRNAGVIFYATNATFAPIAPGANAVGLYVDLATGALKLYYLGTPGVLLWFEVTANGVFPNF